MANAIEHIYFDNATTSWPKEESVGLAMLEALSMPGSALRGLDRENSQRVFRARKAIAKFFSISDESRVIFQAGATQALNLVISDLAQEGTRILLSESEHNSVTRPCIYYEETRGARVNWIPINEQGVVDLDFIEQAISNDEVDVIFLQHGSNVTGALQPVGDVAKLCAGTKVRLVVDGAQAGGHLDLDLEDEGFDAWICSGHKALGGPKGIGLLILGKDYEPEPLIFGGTGSGPCAYLESSYELPETLEPGTEPLPAIMGLDAALSGLKEKLAERIEREAGLTRQLIEGLSEIDGLRLYGPDVDQPRLPIVSFSLGSKSADEVSFELSQRFNIASRPGLHCAPALHRALGTKEQGGLVRFGLSDKNDATQVARVISAVKMIAAGL